MDSYRILILYFITQVNSVYIENLEGEWSLKDTNAKFENLRATVPGGIYTDLMINQIIGDIFYGNNDIETRWVARTNWTYSRSFDVSDIITSSHINLVFEGLDTFATIFLNDIPIGSSQNMFVRYIFDVKDILQNGTNNIEVRFTSPISMANFLSSKQGYTVPPECPPTVYNGECHANQIRKMQASFSWDWGPAFPSMGIWKDVYLEAFNTSVIRYLVVDYKDDAEDMWLITVSTYLSAKKGFVIKGTLIYQLKTDVSLIEQINNINEEVDDDSDEIRIDYSFKISKLIVRNWWPNGYGAQNLYSLRVTFQNGSEVSSKVVRIGFRKLELIQEEIGSGLSFYFKVNDVPIFAKGANQIPIDVLPEKGQNPERVSRILESAYAANMNMLRVWGGGVYESDFFYDKTDELGILIWQDFMFACAMYPTYPDFLDSVRAEVRHQAKRLKSHPSIALWAGNNENEIALVSNWYGTQTNLSLYKTDYLKLYVETIRAEFENITDNVIFLTSSPSNGKESEQENFLASNPGDPAYGDVHFYNYLLDSLQPLTYPIPRFASEFGYQSLPEVDTWLTTTNNISDLHPDSPFMFHRQHHPLGFIENNLLINYQLKLNSSVTDFYKTYIYYSQIVQAISIKFETEYYRSFMGRLNNGLGNTMGALFWQLNDVWVAPTWSGIDYRGKWKMLHYFATEFFASTIITGYLDISRQLHIFVVSEVSSLLNADLEVEAKIEIYNWKSFDPIDSIFKNVSLVFGKSIEITVLDTDSYLQEIGCGSLATARNNCFFYLTLFSGNSVIAPHNFLLSTALKQSELAKTSVEISQVVQIDDQGKKFIITVSTNGVSLFIWLDSHQIFGRFNENGFLQVVPNKNVTFHAEEATSVSDLNKTLTIVHLNHLDY